MIAYKKDGVRVHTLEVGKNRAIKILSRFRRFDKKKILDVGCGTNSIKKYVVDEKIIGIDVNNKNADIIGSATNLPFKENVFEGVICNHVIEHMTVLDVKRLCSEIHRILINNGILVLGAPYVHSPSACGQPAEV
jgi:ubiquinone/menaquinone biosynthesis C-methylase UbiE